MKVAVVGAGSIGGWIAARLALAGYDPTVLVRPGRTFDTLTLYEGRSVQQANLRVIEDASSEKPHQAVVFAVKAFALADAAQAAKPLIGPDTIIVPMINGVLWWFANPPLASVDPNGRIGRVLPFAQVVGSVVHAAVHREDDKIHVSHADKIILGDPEGGASERVHRTCALLESAGIRPDPTNNVRRAIWYKAWGNMTMNPLSALTLATADRIIAECRPLILACMEEARTIGEAIDCPITERGEDRIEVTARLGAFKTSMLQDVEAGRAIELEALVGAPREIGRRVGIATPNIDLLYAMTRMMAESRRLV